MGITLSPARPVPGLPPFDPAAALTLAAACRQGLVPGHDGRRLSADELAEWAAAGVRLTAAGPPYLFPAAAVGGELRTTPAWCAAWVRFVALARAYCQPRTHR